MLFDFADCESLIGRHIEVHEMTLPVWQCHFDVDPSDIPESEVGDCRLARGVAEA